MIHDSHPGHVPLRDVTVEFICSGNYVVVEQLPHFSHSRHIPGFDWLVRTLRVVSGVLKALFKGGLELVPRLWRPRCCWGKIMKFGQTEISRRGKERKRYHQGNTTFQKILTQCQPRCVGEVHLPLHNTISQMHAIRTIGIGRHKQLTGYEGLHVVIEFTSTCVMQQQKSSLCID